MANRAYLYSVDEIPGQEKGKLSIKGLSEWKYSIPPVYLLLVSGNTNLCKSIIRGTGEKISLIGNYEEGIQNLNKLINLIKENNVQSPEVFNRLAKEAIEFLESNKHKQKYILLETCEIFEMSIGVGEIGANEKEINLVLKESQTLLGSVNKNSLEEINNYVGDDIRTHWEDLLGINYWQEILYFHFG